MPGGRGPARPDRILIVYQRAHPGARDGLREVIEKAAGHPAGQPPVTELLPGLAPQELPAPWLVTAAEVR